MAVIPFIDLARIVDEAGFPKGTSQATALAIIAAESGRRTDAVHTNPPVLNPDGTVKFPASEDRGLWQINDYWHAEVSDACAFDPVCSTEAALRISANGTSWSSWAAYNNGSYKAYLDAAKVALDGLSRLRKAEQALSACLATAESLRVQLGEKSAQIAELEETIAGLTEELALARARVVDLEAENAGLTATINAKDAQIAVLTTEISSLQGQLADALASGAILQGKIAAAQAALA